jgi:hypothetical protein
MTLPHQIAFRFRGVSFCLAALASLYLSARTPGIGRGVLVLSAALATVAAVTVYYYTRWLVRLDAKFRHVHPRKFAYTTLVVFYGSIGLAAGLICFSPLLIRPAPDAPVAQVVCFLLVPVLLAGAAAAVRVRHECE